MNRRENSLPMNVLRRAFPLLLTAYCLGTLPPLAVLADDVKQPAAATQETAKDSATPASDPAAEKLMIKAHQARSGWGDGFPGFTARLSVNLDGKETQGTAKIDADGSLTIDLPPGPALEWATRQLESIAMHNSAGVKDKYDVSFADNDEHHPLGRLIRFHGGELHSVYRVRDDVITEVHRNMGKTKFTISVTEIDRTPAGKVLPKHFNVSYWNAETGELTANHDFAVEWTPVKGFELPSRRLLVSTGKDERKVYELTLSDHKLLDKKPTTGK